MSVSKRCLKSLLYIQELGHFYIYTTVSFFKRTIYSYVVIQYTTFNYLLKVEEVQYINISIGIYDAFSRLLDKGFDQLYFLVYMVLAFQSFSIFLHLSPSIFMTYKIILGYS